MLAFLVMDDIVLPELYEAASNFVMRMIAYKMTEGTMEEAIKMTGYTQDEIQQTRDFIDSLG